MLAQTNMKPLTRIEFVALENAQAIKDIAGLKRYCSKRTCRDGDFHFTDCEFSHKGKCTILSAGSISEAVTAVEAQNNEKDDLYLEDR